MRSFLSLLALCGLVAGMASKVSATTYYSVVPDGRNHVASIVPDTAPYPYSYYYYPYYYNTYANPAIVEMPAQRVCPRTCSKCPTPITSW